ncbi:MAG TPA: hypothetical protein VK983_00925 [Candidatus Limnocylindrales bacterium]|nr:hypothetical protein [Candidatus Limnocylindrales bacterium]
MSYKGENFSNAERELHPVQIIQNVIIRKRQQVAAAQLAELGLAGKSWDDPEAQTYTCRGNHDYMPLWIMFDKDVVVEGSLLGSPRFQLDELGTSIQDLERATDDDDYETLFKHPRSFIEVKTVCGNKSEEWAICVTPDSPPYAINKADASYLYEEFDNSATVGRVKEAFGEEAVPFLNDDETLLLARAIQETPASVSRFYGD